jgi:hypothetical protein
VRIRPLATAARAAALAAAVMAVVTPPATAAVGTDDWASAGTSYEAPANDRTKVLDLWHVPRAGWDRVVIQLRGAQPDWRTDYTRNFTYEGSGEPVPIRGRAGLRLTLFADGHSADGDNLYVGPRLARPRSDTLRALALAGDFEGQVTFVFALEHRADHRVRHLSGPDRLVLDLRHAG